MGRDPGREAGHWVAAGDGGMPVDALRCGICAGAPRWAAFGFDVDEDGTPWMQAPPFCDRCELEAFELSSGWVGPAMGEALHKVPVHEVVEALRAAHEYLGIDAAVLLTEPAA